MTIKVITVCASLIFLAGCGGGTSGVKPSSLWSCTAKNLQGFSYNGGSHANIHLSSYSSGGDYKVKLNSAQTMATGITADGTPFSCSKKM